MVISSEGYFYCYNIDLEHGGECTLQKQFRYGGYLHLVESVADKNLSAYLTLTNHPV